MSLDLLLDRMNDPKSRPCLLQVFKNTKAHGNILPSTGNTYVLQPGGLGEDWKFFHNDVKDFFVPALYVFGFDRQIIADYILSLREQHSYDWYMYHFASWHSTVVDSRTLYLLQIALFVSDTSRQSLIEEKMEEVLPRYYVLPKLNISLMSTPVKQI
jgi:hypothetical protein